MTLYDYSRLKACPGTRTFSLEPEMAEQVQDVMREEGRTMSELIGEALRNYMEEREWLRTIRYERLKNQEEEREEADRETERQDPV